MITRKRSRATGILSPENEKYIKNDIVLDILGHACDLQKIVDRVGQGQIPNKICRWISKAINSIKFPMAPTKPTIYTGELTTSKLSRKTFLATQLSGQGLYSDDKRRLTAFSNKTLFKYVMITILMERLFTSNDKPQK